MKPRCPPLPPIPEGMDWEKFRQEGHKVVDFIADYYQSLKHRDMPAQSHVKPGYLARQLDITEAPQHPLKSFDPILQDVKQHVVPGMTHWQHPDFFAWFPAQLSPAALLGDTIASAFNQPGFNWMASPAATELEVLVMDWMAKAFGLPPTMMWSGAGGGVLQPTASEAAIVAVLAAKNRALDQFSSNEEKQAASSKLVCYVSDQAHFCTEKACRILSIWHIRKVATHAAEDGNYPMRGADVEALVQEDVKQGLIPFFVSANYGTTGICCVDDFEGIARVCQRHRMWMNLDAAYAGATAICPEMRPPLLPAFAAADSIFINGSKWFSLMTNCTFFFFTDRKYIVSSLNATGVYLQNKYTDANAVVDFKDYQLGMGRPFRALKVFTTLRYLGLDGVQSTIRRHCALARYLHDLLQNTSDSIFELPVAAKFGLVCFRIKDDHQNKRNNALLLKLEEERRVMLVHHVLEGKVLLRVALAYPGLTEEDINNVASYLTEKSKEIIRSVPLP